MNIRDSLKYKKYKAFQQWKTGIEAGYEKIKEIEYLTNNKDKIAHLVKFCFEREIVYRVQKLAGGITLFTTRVDTCPLCKKEINKGEK